MQPQIGYEFLGRVIFWRNVTAFEFFARVRASLSPPGVELTDDEVVSIFQDGLIQRDSRSGRYYRIRST